MAAKLQLVLYLYDLIWVEVAMRVVASGVCSGGSLLLLPGSLFLRFARCLAGLGQRKHALLQPKISHGELADLHKSLLCPKLHLTLTVHADDVCFADT